MAKMVRMLFGKTSWGRKSEQEVHICTALPWANDVAYYTAGQDGYDLLKSRGMTNVTKVFDEPFIEREQFGIFYTRLRLMQRAMTEHGECLFMDFDFTHYRTPDERMWGLLRAKTGRFGGVFQVPIRYYRIYQMRIRSLLKPGSCPSRCVCCCLVYCRDIRWIEDWLSVYPEARSAIAKTARRRGVWDAPHEHVKDNDEYYLQYLIDKTHKLTDAELVECLEPSIIQIRQEFSAAPSKNKDDVYFGHR